MPDSDSPISPREVFATTRWTVVIHAQQGDSTEAREALETLCRAYWYPLYAFVRRQGVTPEDAQDLTQAFFERLIEKNFLADVQREKGRFRSFLLAALKHFLANEWDKGRAQKRGGGAIHVPIDTASAETRYGLEPAHLDTPERLFERRWAITLLDHVLERLRDEHVKAGKAELLEQLKPSLTADKAALGYAELGARVGLSEGAVKVAVHRLRQRYRELLRAEIAETVASPCEVDEELRHLFTALSA
jgi:RNA polymerase sigma-70 factor (ECF subfamily)